MYVISAHWKAITEEGRLGKVFVMNMRRLN
jgi:hypothetical protein